VLFVGQLFRPHWVQRAIIRIFGGMLITRAPVDILSVTPIRKAVAVDPPTILCHPRSSAGSWRATHFFRTKQNNNALLHVLFTGRHSGLKEASRVILEITSVTDIDEVFLRL
jgi:hypothetical protein